MPKPTQESPNTHASYMREWRAKNRERVAEINRACYLRNHEARLARLHEDRWRDPDRRRAEAMARHNRRFAIEPEYREKHRANTRLARANKPVLLKRGPSATVKEWLLAAEYLLSGGNTQVVLCERGIKTFETELRNTLDLAAVALARELSHLPVIADPSHGTGKRELISAASRAAIAIGADGIMVEVHPCPERALSDGPQSLDFTGFESMMLELQKPLRAVAGPTVRTGS